MTELTRFMEIIKNAKKPEQRWLIAIDGRCAAGKTTLASLLQNEIGCTVFHMDDFFLRPEQRTPERLSTPGGNVDDERFLSEVLLPLKSGAEWIAFRAFDCSSMRLKPSVRVRGSLFTTSTHPSSSMTCLRYSLIPLTSALHSKSSSTMCLLGCFMYFTTSPPPLPIL